jgi:hypothetical protein
MPPDELDTLIQSWMAAPEATRLLPKPVPAPAQQRVRQPHRVVWFARGTAWWLFVAIELSVLQLLWHLHG